MLRQEQRGIHRMIELLHCIDKNDISLLERKIKNGQIADVMLTFLESIISERKLFFDFLLERCNILSNHLCDHIETGYYERCFAVSLHCEDPYYAMKILEVYDLIPIYKRFALLHIAIFVGNEYISHQLVIKGTNLNTFDLYGLTPLHNAIKHNNLNLVCMLLYYGADTDNLPHFANLTPFIYSITCQCTKEIQSILIEYETDFNLICKGISVLFFAIQNQSPVTLEIIEYGADVNYYDGTHNAISLAMIHDCEPNVFKEIWDRFDYSVWKISSNKSVLITFLQDTVITKWWEYLYIFMENETKLELDLDHHNNSHFFYPDPIISTLYLQCIEKGIHKSKTESFVLHLLSHGAHIFRRDIDIIYKKLKVMTPFLELLLYMDLLGDFEFNSVMYFKYTPIPDIKAFLANILFSVFLSDALNILKHLRRFYAFESDLKLQIMDILSPEETNYEACKKVVDESVTFPSLLQLSRDSARRSIFSKYIIDNSCKLYTVVKYLNLPKYIENVLFYRVSLYYFPS